MPASRLLGRPRTEVVESQDFVVRGSREASPCSLAFLVPTTGGGLGATREEISLLPGVLHNRAVENGTLEIEEPRLSNRVEFQLDMLRFNPYVELYWA